MYNTPITKAEIEKVLINYSTEQFYSIETVDGLARKFGSNFFYTGNPNYHIEFLKKINAIEPKDLHKLIAKYFVGKTLTVTSLLQKGASDHDKKMIQKFASEVSRMKTTKKFAIEKGKGKDEHSINEIRKKPAGREQNEKQNESGVAG